MLLKNNDISPNMKKKLLVSGLFILMLVIFGCATQEAPEGVAEEVSAVDKESVPESQSTEQIVEEKQQAPTLPTPTTPSPSPLPTPPVAQSSPTLIDGKTLSERLAEAYQRLHTRGSAAHIRKSFPDLELVYTDHAVGMPFPREIIPFRYYYSREANTTFNICAIELTVFICKGKLDHLIRRGDVDSGRCELTLLYFGDPRL